MKIKFKKLTPTAKAPTRAYEHDAGYDLYADRYEEGYDQWKVFCGCAFEIPAGYVGLIFPRSSVVKTDLRLANSVGVIDSGYRGEVSAVFDMYHRDDWDSNYKCGDRFAQLVIMPLAQYELEEADELSESDRGKGGYGSSGN